MKESIIQGKIRALLINEGFYVVKLINTSKPGIPDLMAIKDGRVIFFEVKSAGGKVSKLQEHQMEQLREIGVEAYVVRSTVEVKSLLTNVNYINN
jgi:Holliday junction resolvase